MSPSRLALAVDAAKAAAAVAMRYFQSPDLEVDLKLDRSVVTRADREAEELLRRAIEAAFPRDAIVGEEFGTKAGDSGYTWYLDPIDGTQAYARGVPLFGTLVGIEAAGAPHVGVIALPALGELVVAEKGHGCHWTRGMRLTPTGSWEGGDTTQARVSRVASMREAMFCTTWMQSFQAIGRTDLFMRLCDATGMFRGWGDCYGYALVATGRAEIMVDPVLHVWDAAPMPVILAEAGGRYTSFAGEPGIHGTSGVATNGLLHEATLALLR